MSSSHASGKVSQANKYRMPEDGIVGLTEGRMVVAVGDCGGGKDVSLDLFLSSLVSSNSAFFSLPDSVRDLS